MAIRSKEHPGLVDVIVAGDIFIDLILSGFAAWPEPGTEAFAQEFHREIGGGAAISACGLARLGSRTSVLAVVGHDTGEWVAGRLAESGVETADLQFDPAASTAFSVAISMPEDRTYLTFPGSNRAFPRLLSDAAARGQLSRARHVHLACAPDLASSAHLFQAMHNANLTVSLDVGWHENWLSDPRAMALLPHLDLFFPNEIEARKMTGEQGADDCLRRFQMAGAHRVALKLGHAGAALLCDGEILHVPPHPVQPIDTIGAGDSFDAGFLHYWLKGESPLTCLRAANFCGAVSTAKAGGIEGFPEVEQVERALRGNSNE